MVPFNDVTRIENWFQDIHRMASEKIKDSMSNAEFDPEKRIDELLSLKSNLSKNRYDFLEFYIQLLKFNPEAQWEAIQTSIWQKIQHCFQCNGI